MSDSPPVPPASDADADATLARTAARGRKERRGWGPLAPIIVLLIPLSAVAWVAWQQHLMQQELAALRSEYAALQQTDTSDDGALARLQQRQQELDKLLQQREEELELALQQRDAELGLALQQHEQELDAAMQQREQQLAAALQRTAQQSIEPLQAELVASDNARAAQAQRIAMLERELAALRRDVGQRVAATEPLADAEAMLRFAQQRLQVARDVPGAIELYRAADAALRNSDDADVFIVRETLARELAALEAVKPVDAPGLFARLGALGMRVDAFDVVSEGSIQDFSVSAVEGTPATGGWWEDIKQTLGEYFVVTSSNAEILPQLGASEQFLVRAQLRLHIEQAKLALLAAQPPVYRSALDDALGLTQRWLRGEGASIDEFTMELAALRDTPIVTELPDTGAAVAALQPLVPVSSTLQAEPTQ